jgi:hypothetical protein
VAEDRTTEGLRRLGAFLSPGTPPAQDSDATANEQRGPTTSIRDEVLAAGESLTAQGRSPFSPSDVITEARRMGSTASAPTIRTGVVQNLRVDTGAVTGGRGFAKVARSKYVLAGTPEPDEPPVDSVTADPSVAFPPPPPPPPAPLSPPSLPALDGPAQPTDPPAAWYRKGSVQSAVVRVLVSDGWDIIRVAHTEAEDDGIDIEARKDGQRLVVEVTGHPATTSSGESDEGPPEPTTTPTDARVWFSTGILSALAMRGDDPHARVVAAYPAVPMYEHLASRVVAPLLASGVEIWLIDEHGVPASSGMSSEL